MKYSCFETDECLLYIIIKINGYLKDPLMTIFEKENEEWIKGTKSLPTWTTEELGCQAKEF